MDTKVDSMMDRLEKRIDERIDSKLGPVMDRLSALEKTNSSSTRSGPSSMSDTGGSAGQNSGGGNALAVFAPSWSGCIPFVCELCAPLISASLSHMLNGIMTQAGRTKNPTRVASFSWTTCLFLSMYNERPAWYVVATI